MSDDYVLDPEDDVDGLVWLAPVHREAFVPRPCGVATCRALVLSRGSVHCRSHEVADRLNGRPGNGVDLRPRLLVDAEALGLLHVLVSIGRNRGEDA